jgi:hypothetical protein
MVLANPCIELVAQRLGKVPHLLHLDLRNGAGLLVVGYIALLAE